MIQNLRISAIRRDFQPEEYMIDLKVAELADALRNGATFPPLLVRYDGESYWLQDGFHRIEAMLSVGSEEVEADVIPGTLADIRGLSLTQ